MRALDIYKILWHNVDTSMLVSRVKGISDERGNEVQFQEINQPKTKATYVAEQIVEVLKTGKYKVGDHLPSERDIAGQMKVSRNSVREALRVTLGM